MGIDGQALELLRKYYPTTLIFPINPFEIATKEGITILRMPEADKCYAGKFDAVKKELYVNDEETVVCQRFVVAHELGHYVLKHGDHFNDSKACFERYCIDPIEMMANLFATALLVPAAPLKKFIDKDGICSRQRLKDIFGVTDNILEFRLRSIGMI